MVRSNSNFVDLTWSLFKTEVLLLLFYINLYDNWSLVDWGFIDNLTGLLVRDAKRWGLSFRNLVNFISSRSLGCVKEFNVFLFQNRTMKCIFSVFVVPVTSNEKRYKKSGGKGSSLSVRSLCEENCLIFKQQAEFFLMLLGRC